VDNANSHHHHHYFIKTAHQQQSLHSTQYKNVDASASTLCWIVSGATVTAHQTCRRSTSCVTLPHLPTTNYLPEPCDCLTMSSTH